MAKKEPLVLSREVWQSEEFQNRIWTLNLPPHENNELEVATPASARTIEPAEENMLITGWQPPL